MKRILCFLLATLLVCPSLTVLGATYTWGDVDGNGKINATDALRILQYSVGKITFSDAQLAVANVSATGKINAEDALMILKYAVGKLDRFPADVPENTPENPSGMTEEELYYAARDAYYGVDGSDFYDSDLDALHIDDAENLVNTLGVAAANSDIVGYRLNEENHLNYTRISDEAKAQGNITRYNTAQKQEGTLTLSDGSVLTYQVPTEVSAYSAVPFQYTLVAGGRNQRMHVGVTTWEEPNRAKNPQAMYFENTLPDDVNISVEYNGYIQADALSGVVPSWSEQPAKDTQGTHYPGYNVGQLTKSGTIPAGKDTWLKFTATNTGNTILKGDGMGYFNITPTLYKKNDQGTYEKVAGVDNKTVRMLDLWYPGETLEFYTRFTNYSSYPEGEYRVRLSGELANEQETPDWAAMYSTGRQVTKSYFSFTVSNNPSVTEPGEVQTQKVGNIVRNGWLGTYEEFQTSFHTHRSVGNNPAKPEQETFYFQPAPWDTTLTIRLISDTTGEMNMVAIPLQVESDSLKITLNPYNQHYIIKEDGTREPILATQNMADMRGNFQDTPYARETVINDLKNMKEAGINYLTSTMGFSYTTGTARMSINSLRFMMDCAQTMGFQFEGYGVYPYEKATAKYSSLVHSYAGAAGLKNNNTVVGHLTNWTYERFGKMFWSNNKGITPIAQEDSRGWLTIDHDWRMDLNDATVSGLQAFLREAYGTIDKLNAAYGSNYTSFSQVDPRKEGQVDSNGYYNFTNLSSRDIYHERSNAVRQMDLYRTYRRVQDYREALSVMKIPGAKMIARYESSPIVTVGLNPNTKNAHYRETYYQMQRGALVGEVLAASDAVCGVSTYQNTPYTAPETYELTKHASRAGLSVMNYHMHYREQVYNSYYGSSKAVNNLHLANNSMKVTSIKTASALFPALKATYEAGGIPAVMWMDYYCNGYITRTSYKEIEFYTRKMKEMLASKEGQAWSTEFEVAGSALNQEAGHIWSYPPAYVEQLLADTPRFNRFTHKSN